MKALIYITIFLMSGIWFTSCKTSRNMETEKQIDYSGDFLYLQNLIESLRLDVNKQTKITTDKLSDLKIGIKQFTCRLRIQLESNIRLKKVLLLHPSRIRKEQKLMKHYPLLCSSSRIDLILLVIRLMFC